MKKIATLLVSLLAFALPGLLRGQSDSHLNALKIRSATPAGQEFFCVGPYSVPECETQIAFLQAVLRKYDSEKLGKWSWILIRSEDWKQIVSQLHLDPASPAFSHLEYRQTFFDEALLVLKPKRELELIAKWNVSFDRFLDFAVSHELGHAFCQESDEVKAERYSQRLRKSVPSAGDEAIGKQLENPSHDLNSVEKPERGKKPSTQHYSCDAALAWKQCLQEVAMLKRAVEKYPTITLGEWTWVLVRSEDWKQLTKSRGLDPNSSSFTFLAMRKTYIDEALVRPVPGRERELTDRWKMYPELLLQFAITHEMGHGICGTASEAQANRVAALLRARIQTWCLP